MNYNETRTKEGGSVASFVVVGLILVALVAGGLYAVNRRGQESPMPAPVVSTTPSTPPATNTPVAQSSSPESPNSTPSTPPAQTAPAAPPTGKGAPLPQTGPEDYMTGGIMFAALSSAFIAYIRSRHELRLASLAVD